MRIQLVAIGNSRGIRIPKPLIEECGFGKTVDVRVENNRLIIAPARAPREGWREAFLAADSPDDHELLLADTPESDFDRDDWKW